MCIRDRDLTAEDLKEVVAIYKEEYKKHAGVEFPQDPKVQLMEAIKAVFRADVYKRQPLDHPPNLSISLVLVNCIAVLALIFLISFYNRIYYIDSFFINQLNFFKKKKKK